MGNCSLCNKNLPQSGFITLIEYLALKGCKIFRFCDKGCLSKWLEEGRARSLQAKMMEIKKGSKNATM